MELQFTFDQFTPKDNEPALDYANDAFGGLCPFPEYDNLNISDLSGEMPYSIDASTSDYNMANYKGLYFKRPINGKLKWSYRVFPRILPKGYRSSPYYDFRNEPLGLNASGMFTFILPKVSENMHVILDWDMSEMPSNARGIWSCGEGYVETEMSAWDMRFTLFNTGVMDAIEINDFGVYWFSQPNFEIKSYAEKLYEVFKYEKDFFNTPDVSFKVFLRRDPFEISGGGSACPGAFISGYSAMGGTEGDHWYNVLIHEMTHSWPYMDDSTVGTGTWYLEGATEYYCTLLPYRGGLATAQFTAEQINEKTGSRYYNNVYREMPNMEIPKIQWQDRRAQTVPYGRGFMYLANVDAKLRKAGKGSIDDITKKYIMPKKQPLTDEVWMEFIKERLGQAGIQDFKDMKAGKLIIPDDDIFGPEFKTIEEEIEIENKKVKSYRWELK